MWKEWTVRKDHLLTSSLLLPLPLPRYLWWPLCALPHNISQSAHSLWAAGHSCVWQGVGCTSWQEVLRLSCFRSCQIRYKRAKSEEGCLAEFGDDHRYIYLMMVGFIDYIFVFQIPQLNNGNNLNLIILLSEDSLSVSSTLYGKPLLSFFQSMIFHYILTWSLSFQGGISF